MAHDLAERSAGRSSSGGIRSAGERKRSPVLGRSAARGIGASLLAIAALLAAPLASAQGAKPAPPPVVPPGTGTDMEIDPDAPKPPPEEEKPAEPPPLPPPDPDAWGVGGKDEEGKYGAGGKTGRLKEEEEAKRQAEEDKKPVDLGLPGFAYIDAVIGFGEINDVTSSKVDATKSSVFSFVFGAQYRAWEIWTIGIRFPYSTGQIKGPLEDTTDDFNTFAVGNLELSLSPTFQITRRLRIVPGLAFAFPSASGDFFAPPEERGSIAQALVNQAVAGSRGWEDNALFASKRFGFTPSVGITYDRNDMHIAARTKIDIMGRTGGEEPNPAIVGQELIALHDPNTTFVVGGSFFYDFLEGKVSPGLRTWLSVFRDPLSNGARDYSGAQFVLEPTVNGKFAITQSGSLAIKAGISYVINTGGPLGAGDNGATIGGLRIKAGLLF